MGWDGIDSRLGGFEFLIMSRGGLLLTDHVILGSTRVLRWIKTPIAGDG